MSIQELLEAVRANGAALRVEGSDLKVRPAGVLSVKLKERLRERKPEIVLWIELITRLSNLKIFVAIDKATQAAMLLFSQPDIEAVRHVATIYEPSEAPLNAEQCGILLQDLSYYEKLMTRDKRRKNVIHEAIASKPEHFNGTIENAANLLSLPKPATGQD